MSRMETYHLIKNGINSEQPTDFKSVGLGLVTKNVQCPNLIPYSKFFKLTMPTKFV